MADVRRFVEEQSRTAFGAALAGVFASLLSLFLVITPFCTLGIPYVPHIATGRIFVPAPADLTVIIDRNGFGYVSDAPQQATLEATVDTALTSGRYRRLIIEADRHARYASLLPIFRAARAHRLPVALVSQPDAVLDLARH